MTFKPQLVALDIDGTLVDSYGEMPKSILAAVRNVLRAGVPVVLATGRSWPATQPVFDQLGLPPGWAVVSNGAVVLEYPPLKPHTAHTFDPSETIIQVARIAPNALIAVEELGRGWRSSKPFPPGELNGTVSYESLEELAARPVTRIVIRDPNSNEEEFAELVEKLNLHQVSYFVGWSAWLDIAPRGIDKATALASVCESLGVAPADVLAIGDGRNDIEMLQWAGRGVAVGDAPSDVKSAADAVALPFSADGTAKELNRWFA